MERGVYFDGWPKNNHCYHPSLPMRSMQMIEDLERSRATLLVWSALGGGSISLPYMEHEAYGSVDPRQRFYGHLNDAEFIAECNKRGIKVFGIVFEVQGWEFPVKVSEDGTQLLAMNVMPEGPGNGSGVGVGHSRHDGTGADDWYGLREFTNGKHDKLFAKTLRDYFPDGLTNSDGEPVLDIWTECAAVDYNGKPVHADWVEVVGHAQVCHQMCRNNPVWRQYLKKIIEIQVDAGCPGVQLDEAELPITSFRYGGCFCKDCRKQFTAFLQERAAQGKLGPEYDEVDLATFDYGNYLKERGISYPSHLGGVPFFREYYEFQMRAVRKYFLELADYIHAYGRSKGRDILVSGNFFNLMPVYYPMETGVDVIISEMKQTLFRQPYWYRYAAGFAGDKPAIIAENPYGGIIHDLAEQLEHGKGYDLYRLYLLEASVYGCNMSVPYGGWMGNKVKTGFYPPRDVTSEIQNFLADREDLFSRQSGSDTLVIYSYPSYYWREAVAGYSGQVKEKDDADEGGILSYFVGDIDDPRTPRLPFHEVIKQLSDNQFCYDVQLTADDDLRADDFSLDHLKGYRTVVMPDCQTMTPRQVDVLEQFAKNGGRLIIFGRIAENVADAAARLRQAGDVCFIENIESDKTASVAAFTQTFLELEDDHRLVKLDTPDVGIQTHKTAAGLAVHLLNYRYRKTEDNVLPIEQLVMEVRLQPGQVLAAVKVHTPDGKLPQHTWSVQNDVCRIVLRNVPLYTVVHVAWNGDREQKS